jgi:hypothetical protein
MTIFSKKKVKNCIQSNLKNGKKGKKAITNSNLKQTGKLT